MSRIQRTTRSTRVRRLAALAAAVAIAASACSSDGASTATAPSSAPSTVASSTASTPTTAAAETSSIIVTETEYGPALSLADGQVLYAFAADTENAGTCVDDCAKKWPPVETAVFRTDAAAMLGSIVRADGTEQLTIEGRPVYTFSGDLPGEASCQGGDGVWWILTPEGSLNEATEPV